MQTTKKIRSVQIETPAFKSEAEEAQWWFDNQDMLGDKFLEAAKNGTLGRGTVMKQYTERQAAKSTTIRLDEGDLTRAKQQAEQKGIRYQTYLKMLLHDALVKAEKKSA
jgi:predicted DNA binding CopG/RHH family protein